MRLPKLPVVPKNWLDKLPGGQSELQFRRFLAILAILAIVCHSTVTDLAKFLG
jgi:hypothetical protein